MSEKERHFLTKQDEIGFFDPKTWFFWRGVVIAFFVSAMVGHLFEIPWCLFMHHAFGIVEPDYAMWEDPLWVPYWVYGFGALILTFTMLPLKIHIVKKSRTMFGAFVKFFLLAVVLCATMETVMGLLINQPDQFGEFPYWNNSVLPGNILGQGWIVNDIALAFVSMFYVWVLFPSIQKLLIWTGEKVANVLFGIICAIMGVCCIMSYVPPVAAFLAG